MKILIGTNLTAEICTEAEKYVAGQLGKQKQATDFGQAFAVAVDLYVKWVECKLLMDKAREALESAEPYAIHCDDEAFTDRDMNLSIRQEISEIINELWEYRKTEIERQQQ